MGGEVCWDGTEKHESGRGYIYPEVSVSMTLEDNITEPQVSPPPDYVSLHLSQPLCPAHIRPVWRP